MGFSDKPKKPEVLQLSLEPLVLLKPYGCGRGGGVVAPPIVFEIQFAIDEEVKLLGSPILVVGSERRSPLRVDVKQKVLGIDRIEISFLGRCPDLGSAELLLPPINIRGSEKVFEPISFEYREETHTEWHQIPDGQWWK